MVVITPQWLDDMVKAEFNTKTSVPRAEWKKFFCVQCGGKALTEADKKNDHQGHHDQVLQARSCNYNYGLLRSDLRALERRNNMDIINGVSVYLTNNNLLICPKPNSTKNPVANSKNVPGLCVTCKGAIEESRFCSILCKFTSGLQGYRKRKRKAVHREPERAPRSK